MHTKAKFFIFLVLTAILFVGVFFAGCRNFPIQIPMPHPIKVLVRIAFPFVVAASLITTIVQYFNIFKRPSRVGPPAIPAKILYVFMAGLVIYLFILVLMANEFCR